jgi:REP element-mobilizing transposase RayT
LTNIRRHHIPNATVFMTAVCAHREKHIEADWAKDLLASVLNEVTSEAGVSIIHRLRFIERPFSLAG